MPNSVVPLGRYNTFQGQLQLLLFNGVQWGLWNIRGASATNFIGSFQRYSYFCSYVKTIILFFRSSIAAANIWRAARAGASPASSLSFDGNGYLFVEQLSDVVDFTIDLREIEIITRPNEENDGLVFYAYDQEVRL